MASSERPVFVKDHHLVFLDNLRESGATNMFGAVPWIRNAYKRLSREQAVSLLSYWMQTFHERHPQKAVKQ